MLNSKIRPFLKWPGSKYRLLNFILPKLPKAKVLVEPFVGSGAIFLNTNYDSYILNDANVDLINLYKSLQKYGNEFICFCKKYFIAKNNTALKYYDIRDEFNSMNQQQDPVIRSALFLYLNRHGYNGLCRFNKRNKFNVPFGRYDKINFPENVMKCFYIKSQIAQFFFQDFKDFLFRLNTNDAVVYCDPPYVPLSSTSSFISYQPGGFDLIKQQELVELAIKLSQRGLPVIVSNHFTRFTKSIYSQATDYITFKVRRTISCDVKNRNHVTEILASYI
jgi:DNA adenine methylase